MEGLRGRERSLWGGGGEKERERELQRAREKERMQTDSFIQKSDTQKSKSLLIYKYF